MARAIPMERGLPRFSTRPRIGSIAKHVVLVVVALIVAYPFYFMVTSSFGIERKNWRIRKIENALAMKGTICTW